MSETPHEEHSSPIKTPKQLITVVLLAFLVPIILIVMLSQLVTSGLKGNASNTASAQQTVAERLKPVGQLAVIDPNAPKVEKAGKEVVDAVCSACHGSGALGAPKIGDSAGWSKRIAGGYPHLIANAIKGVGQMPARGGNPDLTDDEIARAVAFMANQSGANFKEPELKKPAAGSGK